jgi:hypothetical protein
MSPVWLVLAAIAIWGLIRLGRSSEGRGRGRGQWRVAATLFSSILVAGAALAAFRGSWLIAGALAAAGLWLTIASRQRAVPPRAEGMTDAEARSLLGVSASATKAQINAEWKRLMGRAHPDQGGTQGLAARLNAARDHLLKR